MTDEHPGRAAVIVYLTAEDEEIAAALVAAALQGKATIDGRHLSYRLRGNDLTAEVAAVESLARAFGGSRLTVTPGHEPYRYKDDE